MNCHQCQGELTAFMDGELNGNTVRTLESHLRDCPHCARELANLRASATFVEKNSRDLSPAPELWHGVRLRIAEQSQSAPGSTLMQFFARLSWPVPAAVAALAVLITIGTWGILQFKENERSLNQYMNSYIHSRELQEQFERAQRAKLEQDFPESAELPPDSSDNPFSETSYNPDDNPFRSEDQ